MDAACAHPQHAHSEDYELADLALDPTLASCCLKDLQNQRRADALREQLKAVDRTRAQPRVVLDHAPPHAGDDAAADAELRQLREKRLLELQAQAQSTGQQRAAGYGQLNDVAGAEQLMARIESAAGCSVCHLAVEGHEPSAQLDQHLEALAHVHRGTLFLRTLVGRKSPLITRLSLPGVPALVCFRDGAVVGRTGLQTFGPPDEVLEEMVVDYLKRLGVLRSSPGNDTSTGGGGGASSDEEGQEELKYQPCEVCGRCYPHEHVKAVYREHPDEDSDFSDT